MYRKTSYCNFISKLIAAKNKQNRLEAKHEIRTSFID
jgi:hypothetical protein